MPGPADRARSDALLAEQVAHGDVAAFETLYERYVHEVYALAAHVLGRAAAEEAVQDIFLRLWERAGQFEPRRGPFGGWFMSLARHRVIDEIRRRPLQEIPFADIEELIASPRELDDVESDVWRKERGTRILGALRSLPTEQRRVLVLSYFGGLSQRAIAQMLGWPLGTVKKRIRLGLEKLRVSLEDERDVVIHERQTIWRR
jgi:RNA polymerase sigma-70 factor (ECF subfamily)